jgi:diacylglycerol kinase family enzyme
LAGVIDRRPVVVYFAHAATVGLNVNFAKLATLASARARLGRLTYLVAAMYPLRGGTPFKCALEHDGVVDELSLLQLSVISAPVIGGALGLNVRGPHPDDHTLDVLAVEDVTAPKTLCAGLFLLLGIKRPVAAVRALHVERLGVGSEHPLGLALDGELDGTLPGQFETAAGAVRVITPRRSTVGTDEAFMHDASCRATVVPRPASSDTSSSGA